MVILLHLKGLPHYEPRPKKSRPRRWWKSLWILEVFCSYSQRWPQNPLKSGTSSWQFSCPHSWVTLKYHAQSDVKVLKPPHYSSDLAPWKFWFFPSSKECLYGVNFETQRNLVLEWENSRNRCQNQVWECFQKSPKAPENVLQLAATMLKRVFKQLKNKRKMLNCPVCFIAKSGWKWNIHYILQCALICIPNKDHKLLICWEIINKADLYSAFLNPNGHYKTTLNTDWN